jgi:hypothetical protein
MNKNLQSKEHRDHGPWWRHPWPWILMAGPLVAVIGCAITMTLAFKSFSDQPIFDGGMKRGLIVEKHMTPPTEVKSR